MDNERQKTILELDQYIALCQNRLGTLLTALDWTEGDTLKENTLNKKLKCEEDKNDPFLPESLDCKNSVFIGKEQMQTILKVDNVLVPKKFSDIQLNYTREQKLKLYEYAVLNTAKTSEPELKVPVPNDGNDMTFAEIVAKAKKKDKKLQRKYRTSKPTHIEEVRNLVHLQMQALENYLNPEHENLNELDEQPKAEELDKKRHRSRSPKSNRSSPLRKKSRRDSKQKTPQDESKKNRIRSKEHRRCDYSLNSDRRLENKETKTLERSSSDEPRSSSRRKSKKEKKSKKSKKKHKHRK